MRMVPPETKLFGTVGTTFTIDVTVEGVTDLGGLQFNVEYDGTILNVTDVREGPFLGSLGDDTICVEGGLYFLACILNGASDGPDGGGVIAEIDFAVKAPFVGFSSIALQDCDAADFNGVPIELFNCAGSAVLSNPTPTPTLTATPTATATPTLSPTPTRTATPAPPTPVSVGGISRYPVDGARSLSDPAGGGDGIVWIAAGVLGLAAALGLPLALRPRAK
jgi:hypothetical protein